MRGRGADGAEANAASLAPPPRANADLLGHEAVESGLRQLYASGRLPHALLLCGPRGIGKATLAFRFARHVLANPEEAATPSLLLAEPHDTGLALAVDNGAFRRVAAGSHADLLTIERGYDPRRRRLRSEIVVDDAREIAAFLRLTPAEGGWRVVIVDSADEMNRNAANALLKILEEPPQRALLLLLAHSPGRLLPTIRSRCRRLSVAPLLPATVADLLARYRPDLGERQRAALTTLSGGSIGRALELAAAGGVELYETVLGLLSREPGIDPVALEAFADRLARADAEDAYRAVAELVAQLLARFAAAAAGRGDAGAPEQQLLRRLGDRTPAARWADLRDEIGGGFARTDALNLDRKQAILGAFFAIADAAR